MSEELLRQMLDYKELVELHARFVRTVDARDWQAYRDLFADEGVFDFGAGYVVEGGDAFVREVRTQLEGAVSVHRAFLPEIEFTSATEAKGTWAVNDYIEWASDPTSGERRGFQGFGYEHEVYCKIDGAWKIAGWRVHYLRMDPLPRAPLPETINGGPEVLRDDSYIAGVTERAN